MEPLQRSLCSTAAAGGYLRITPSWTGPEYDDKYNPGTPELFIKQARPYPGWNSETSLQCTEE